MFICSECGAKYEIMPKFCDCGNDIFIEEKETQTQISDIEIPQEQPARRKGRGKIESFSPIAVGIFVLCLILSFTVLFFIGNPKKEIIAEEQNTQIQPEETVEIPSIDSFWDNTIAKIEQKEEPQEEPKEKPIIDKMPKFVQNIIPQETKKVQIPKVNKANIKPAIPAKVQQTSKTSTQKVQQTPQVQTQTNQQAQAVTNRIKQQYNNPAPQNSAQTQTSQPIQTTNTPPATQTTQVQTTAVNNHPAPTTTQASAQTPTVKTKSQAEIIREINTYKASLRNTIGRKIDFTKVIGDGDCTLTFKINSSGRLISKAFTKQSSNITLNDAVFTAMNSIKSYNPPPEGYKGEALTLRIKFYNGNFEITLN